MDPTQSVLIKKEYKCVFKYKSIAVLDGSPYSQAAAFLTLPELTEVTTATDTALDQRSTSVMSIYL